MSPRGAASPRGAVQLRARLGQMSRESGFVDAERVEEAKPNPVAATSAVAALKLSGNPALARVRDRSRAVVEGAPPAMATADWKPLQQFGKPRRNSLCAMFNGDPVLRMVQLLCEYPFYVERVAVMVDSTDTQRLADALVNVSVPFGRTLFLVKAMIESEFQHNKTQVSSILRGNCVASKLMGAFSFFVGLKYLDALVGRLVRDVVNEGERLHFEVDPSREPSAEARTANRSVLTQWAMRLLNCIVGSPAGDAGNNQLVIPPEICSIAKFTADNAQSVCPENLNQLVGGYLILRLINPVLVAPEAYGIAIKAPSQHARRNLTLLSKLLQNVSNGTISASKEPYMMVFTDFVKGESERLGQYLREVVEAGKDMTGEPAIPVEEADVGFLQGRHLSFLHNLLSQRSDDLSKDLASQPRNTLKELELFNILTLVTRDMAKAKPSVGQQTPASPWVCPHLRSGYITKMGDKKRKKHKKRFRLELTRFFLYFFEEEGNNSSNVSTTNGSTTGKLVKTVPIIGMTVALTQVKREAVLELTYHGRAHQFVNHDNSESVAGWAQSLQSAAEGDVSAPQAGNPRFVNDASRGAVSDVLTAFYAWPRLQYRLSVSETEFSATPVPAATVRVSAFEFEWSVKVTLPDLLEMLEALQKEIGTALFLPTAPHVLTRDQKRSGAANQLDYGLYVAASGAPSAGLRVLGQWLTAFFLSAQSNPLLSHSRSVMHLLELDSPFRAASQASLPHLRWIHRYFIHGLGEKSQRGDNVLMHIVSDSTTTTAAHLEIIKFLIDARAVDLKDVDQDGNSALHRAIIAKSNQHALLLCEMGIDHLPNKFLQYPIHLAASIGEGLEIQELINACYQSNAGSFLQMDRKGRTGLHLAVTRKDKVMAKQILELIVAHIEASGGRDKLAAPGKPLLAGTPQNSILHLALVNHMPDVAVMLLRERLVDFTALNLEGQSALHVAARAGNLDAVKILLEHKSSGGGVNLQDRRKMTPILCAALGGNASVFEALMDSSADLDVVDDAHRSIIFCVAEGGSTDCMSLLLSRCKLNVNVVDAVGRTPLHAACLSGSDELAKLLLSHGAKINAADKAGQTPFLCAARAQSYACCKLLNDEGGVDVKETDSSRHDALYYAVEAFDPLKGTELVSYLISLGVKPHNLLPQAAAKASLPLLLLLINAKADPNSMDRQTGSTALHVAVQQGNLPMVMALLDAGAAWSSVKNFANETPLSLAVASKRKELVVVFANHEKK